MITTPNIVVIQQVERAWNIHSKISSIEATPIISTSSAAIHFIRNNSNSYMVNLQLDIFIVILLLFIALIITIILSRIKY